MKGCFSLLKLLVLSAISVPLMANDVHDNDVQANDVQANDVQANDVQVNHVPTDKQGSHVAHPHRHTQSISKSEQRNYRPFFTKTSPDAGLIVPVPANPLWSVSVFEEGNNTALLLQSPPMHYPSTAIQISRNPRYGTSLENLPGIALSATNVIRESSSANPLPENYELEAISVGVVEGFQDSYSIETETGGVDMRNIIGVFPSGHLVTVTVGTPEGQIEHIEFMLNKILSNLEELDSHIVN